MNHKHSGHSGLTMEAYKAGIWGTGGKIPYRGSHCRPIWFVPGVALVKGEFSSAAGAPEVEICGRCSGGGMPGGGGS